MVTFKKEKRTTYAIGPISVPRMREIMEDLWKSAGVGRDTMREVVTQRGVLRLSKDFYHPELVWPGLDYINIFSLIPYKGVLYAGVGTAGEIWGFDGEEWTLAWRYPYETETGHYIHHRAAPMGGEIFSVDNHLYFGDEGARAPPDGAIIIKFDGTAWKYISFNMPAGHQIVAVREFNQRLYAGSKEGSGWVWTSGDGETWTQLWREPDRKEIGRGMRVYGGNLYLTAGPPAPSKVYQYDGTTFTEVLSLTDVSHLYSAEVFNGKLYIGGKTTDDKATLLIYDGTSWSRIIFDKLGVIWDMYVPYYVPYFWTGQIIPGGLLLMGLGFHGSGELIATDGVRFYDLLDVFGGEVTKITSYKGMTFLATSPYSSERSRACVYTVPPEGLSQLMKAQNKPKSFYFIDSSDLYKVKGKTIPAAGFTSCPIPILGRHGSKTVYLLSNQDGTIDIELDQFGDGDWQTYLSESVTANTLYRANITGGSAHVRITFDPTAEATVTAKLVLD